MFDTWEKNLFFYVWSDQSMALDTSTSACCKLEEGSASLKKTTSVKQTMSNQESKTNIFANIVQPIIAELVSENEKKRYRDDTNISHT